MLDRLNWIKGRFRKKKKTYTSQAPDLTSWAYWLIIISFGAYFIISTFADKKLALPILLFFPALIGVFAILFILPVRALTFFLTEIVQRIYLFHTPKNIPSETVIVVGKNDYSRPSFWATPNYDTDILLLVKYLRMLGKPFSIHYVADVGSLDKIMADKRIRTVYLFGHGRRHGFAIDSNTVVDYCRYDNPRFKKDFVYQVHCNGGKGKSLVEYVVPQKNRKECLPEHGLMTNLTTAQMFIDKILKLKEYKGNKAFFVGALYTLLTVLISIVSLIAWAFIFFNIVT